MSFLAPLFFVALGTLSIPVLIHLTQRERKQIVEFPSLMFLQQIPYRSVRRRRIRNWVLLLMRLAALALIVLAFTRPFLNRPSAALASSLGPREVVILLDRSYSMAYGDRWERAQAAARRIVQDLGADDRATLILFGTGAELDVRSTIDRGRLLAGIDAATVSSQATRYAPALKLAQRVLVESRLPRREAILISDFQRNGWIPDDSLRLPEAATFTPLSIADSQPSNVTVSSVMLQRSVFSGQERLTVSAGLVNRGPGAAANLRVNLEIDGRTLETQTVTVNPAAPASVAFQPFTLARPYTRGIVKIATDRLPRDDTFHFVVSPAQRLPVLLVQSSRAARDASLFLTRALGIGTAPTFQVETRQAERLSSGDFGNARVIILNDTALPGSAQPLTRFVEQGGGLLVVLGERAVWGADATRLLPGIPGSIIDRVTGRGGSLAELDYGHPVLEIFKAPRSGNLSTARFFRYRALTITGGNAGASSPQTSQTPQPATHVIGRFDDGAVAMAERTLGLGRVITWTSTLDNFWNDLALKPVYLPFVHQIVRHLAVYEEPAPWFTVGQVVEPGHLLQSAGYGAEAASGAGIVVGPSGKPLMQPGRGAAAPVEVAEPGFYEVRARSADGQRSLTIAANLDTTESDLTPLDLQELSAALAGRAGAVKASLEAVELTPDDHERRQATWWYLLLAGIVFLGLETVVSNFLSRAESNARRLPSVV